MPFFLFYFVFVYVEGEKKKYKMTYQWLMLWRACDSEIDAGHMLDFVEIVPFFSIYHLKFVHELSRHIVNAQFLKGSDTSQFFRNHFQ